MALCRTDFLGRLIETVRVGVVDLLVKDQEHKAGDVNFVKATNHIEWFKQLLVRHDVTLHGTLCRHIGTTMADNE